MLANLCAAMPDDHGVDTTFWQPLTVQQTVELMTGLDVAWWIAGGWAIDLFLNRSIRNHNDTDVLFFARIRPTSLATSRSSTGSGGLLTDPVISSFSSATR